MLDKSYHQLQVEAFMLRGGQAVPVVPAVPSFAVRKLRASLVLEEALELVRALGVCVTLKKGASILTNCKHQDIVFHAYGDPDDSWRATGEPFDMVEAIDGCLDLRVVTTGTLSAMGVPDAVLQMEVDNNNLMKFGPGCTIRDDGKVVKPPDHKPPRIAHLLDAMFPGCLG